MAYDVNKKNCSTVPRWHPADYACAHPNLSFSAKKIALVPNFTVRLKFYPTIHFKINQNGLPTTPHHRCFSHGCRRGGPFASCRLLLFKPCSPASLSSTD